MPPIRINEHVHDHHRATDRVDGSSNSREREAAAERSRGRTTREEAAEQAGQRAARRGAGKRAREAAAKQEGRREGRQREPAPNSSSSSRGTGDKKEAGIAAPD